MNRAARPPSPSFPFSFPSNATYSTQRDREARSHAAAPPLLLCTRQRPFDGVAAPLPTPLPVCASSRRRARRCQAVRVAVPFAPRRGYVLWRRRGRAPAGERTAVALFAGDLVAMAGMSLRAEYSFFRKKKRELGCPSFLWNFAYWSVQFPCFLLWMSSIRSMCLTNHPGLDNGGILWFHNLTEFTHGAFGPVFPILVAGLHYLNIQIAFQKSHTKQLPGVFGLLAKYYKIYLDILAIPLFLIAYVVPQGSLVYWTTNGLFSVAQQLSLRNDVIRKMLGLPDSGAHSGNASPSSLREGQKMMQTNLQQWPLGGTHVQSKLGSSDNETPKFMFENGTMMEENVSEPSSPEELLEQALQYLQTGCREQAIPLIKTAIEKNPDNFAHLLGMGQNLFSNMLFAEASVCFEHAIPLIEEHHPLLILAYFGAGLSRQQQGDSETAIKLLQRIGELKEPEEMMNKACYFKGFIALASILLNEGRKSEAAKYLRLAMAYDPNAERLLKECEDTMDDQPSQQNTEPPDLKRP